MRKSGEGFTLLEILIAIAIFGMVIGLAYSSYNATFHIINSAEEQTDTFAKARISMERIMADIESFYMGKEMFFKGKRKSIGAYNGDSLEFTSTAHIQLYPEDISTGPVVIRYQVAEDPESDSLLLYRLESPLLKHDTNDKDNPGLLLSDSLKEVIFSYRDEDGEEKESWGDEDDTGDDSTLPSLIHISLRFNENKEEGAGTLFQTAIRLPATENAQTSPK